MKNLFLEELEDSVNFGRLNDFIVDKLSQLDQKPIKKTSDYQQMALELADDELLIDNSNYSEELSYFNVYDNSGQIVLSLEDDWVNDYSPDYFIESDQGFYTLVNLLSTLFYDHNCATTLVIPEIIAA